MKYIVVTAFVALFSTSIATAQGKVENTSTETTTKKVMQEGKKLFETKVVKEEIQQLKFEAGDADSYEKDIDLDGSPIKVIKTVWIDNDMDNQYDKVIRLTYNKAYDENVIFDTTADGLVFTDKMGRTMMVKDVGFYVLNPSQKGEIYITVDTSTATY